MIVVLAQEVIPTNLQGPAWAVGAAIIIYVLVYAAKTVLDARYGAGSVAAVKEMEAKAALLKAQTEANQAAAKLAQTDVDDVSDAYEEKLQKTIDEYKQQLKDFDTASKLQLSGMQAHVDIIDKKLDSSEQRERNCIEALSVLKGRLQIIEDLKGIKEQIDANKSKIKELESISTPTTDKQ